MPMAMRIVPNYSSDEYQKAFIVYGDIDKERGTVTIFKNRFGNEIGIYSIERFKEIVEKRIGPDYPLNLKSSNYGNSGQFS